MTGILDQDSVNTSLSHKETYTYDSLNRLTNAAATGNSTYNLTFAYDPFGNMSCQINGQTSGYCADFLFNPSTNQINLAGVSYDAAGDFMADASHTYQYDAEGHLTGVDNGSTATLAYNALGQEVEAKWPSYQLENQYDPHGRLSGVYSVGEARWWNGDIWWGGRTLSRTWGWSFQHERFAGITTMTSLNDGSIGIDELWNPWGGA